MANCPAGFVQPSSPLDPRVIAVTNGNGCALACTLPGYFTKEERTTLLQIMIGVSAVGLLMISAVILTWSTNRIRMEKQYLILIFACLSAFFSLWILIASSKALISDHTFCSTNATEMDQRDGINVCVVEGAVIVYCLLAISFTWTLQAVELFRKLVMLKLRSSKMRILTHLGIIFGLPSFAILYGAYQGGFGYGRILPFCMISHSLPSNLDFTFLYLPMFISAVVGAIAMIAVIGRIGWNFFAVISIEISHKKKTSTGRRADAPVVNINNHNNTVNRGVSADLNNHNVANLLHRKELSGRMVVEASSSFSHLSPPQQLMEWFMLLWSCISHCFGGPSSSDSHSSSTFQSSPYCYCFSREFYKKMKLLRTSAVYFAVYLLLWMTIIGYKVHHYLYFDQIATSVEEWTTCVFLHYDGMHDISWINVCGEKHAMSSQLPLVVWFLICISGHSIFITLIYLPAIYDAGQGWLKKICSRWCRKTSKRIWKRNNNSVHIQKRPPMRTARGPTPIPRAPNPHRASIVGINPLSGNNVNRLLSSENINNNNNNNNETRPPVKTGITTKNGVHQKDISNTRSRHTPFTGGASSPGINSVMFMSGGYGSGLQGDSEHGRDRDKEKMERERERERVNSEGGAKGGAHEGTHGGVNGGANGVSRGVKSPLSMGASSRRVQPMPPNGPLSSGHARDRSPLQISNVVKVTPVHVADGGDDIKGGGGGHEHRSIRLAEDDGGRERIKEEREKNGQQEVTVAPRQLSDTNSATPSPHLPIPSIYSASTKHALMMETRVSQHIREEMMPTSFPGERNEYGEERRGEISRVSGEVGVVPVGAPPVATEPPVGEVGVVIDGSMQSATVKEQTSRDVI